MKISNETRQKSYLVTGSNSGIGLSICNNFLENRSKVLGISRRRAEIFNNNFKHISADGIVRQTSLRISIVLPTVYY